MANTQTNSAPTYGQATQDTLLPVLQFLSRFTPTGLVQNAAQGIANSPITQNPGISALQGILGNGNAEASQSPYQDGANKALKKLGEQHVMEAVQAGKSPMDIQAHPIMNPGGAPQMSQGMLQTSPYQQGQAGFAPQAPQPKPNQVDMSGMPHQQNVGAAILRTLLGGNLGPNLFPNQNDMLAKQQAYGQTPQGAVNIKATENALPLSTEQQATVGANIYGSRIKAAQDQLTNIQKQEEDLNARYKNLTDVRGFIKKGLGGNSDEMNKVMSDIDSLAEAKKQALLQINTLMQNPPVGKQSKESVTNKIQKVGRFQVQVH